MGFFNMNKSNDYQNDDYSYMDDDDIYAVRYDTEEYIDDYCDSYTQTMNDNSYDYYNYNNSNMNINKDKEFKKKNRYVKKARKKSKKKDIRDYRYSTGYENEQVYYNDEGEEILELKRFNIGGMLVITLMFLYLIFIGIGVFGTTFSNGYNAQIITPNIRGQRVTYNKCMKKIEKLEKLDVFNGAEELQELYKLGNFQSRIAILKESLGKITQVVDDMESATYKVKENDYINIEMIDMVKDLYSTQANTLISAIKFYESMSGYTSSTESLEQEQNNLLNQQQVYKNKLSNYKVRFQQIKAYDLKLED